VCVADLQRMAVSRMPEEFRMAYPAFATNEEERLEGRGDLAQRHRNITEAGLNNQDLELQVDRPGLRTLSRVMGRSRTRIPVA